MLTKSPPGVPNSLIPTRICQHLHLLRWKSAKNGCGFSVGSRKWQNERLFVKAGYTRKPMETAGAYQLIDDETGERLIVWGGLEDDSPLPTKEVISWKPSDANIREVFGTTEDKSTASVSSRGRITGRNFTRLKAHSVRALIQKSSRAKEVSADNKEELSIEDEALNAPKTSDSELELVPRKNKVGLVGLKDTRLSTPRAQRVKEPYRSAEYDYNDLPRSDRVAPKSHEQNVTNKEPTANAPRRSYSLKGWNNAVSAQISEADRLKLLKGHRKTSAAGFFFTRKSFKDLGCSDDMIESLRAQNILRPSHIQGMSYVPVFEGKTCIIADQSGSGKTLAYLAPVIQRLRQEELEGLGKSSPRCPRVVVLVPTAELASQVLANCRSISRIGVPFRSMVATGGFCQKTQLDNLQQNIDVLIATPGRFIYLLQEGFLLLTNLKCVVLDEVDILFGDEGFEQVLQSFISSAPVTTQYLFVTATLPGHIYNKLVEVFPDCKVIMGPGLHCTNSGLEEILVDCSGDDSQEKTPETAFMNKKSALLQLVEETAVPKTIVFCNKIETCRKVENVLNRFDRKGVRIRVLPFHAAITQKSRLSNMEEFLNSQSEDSLFLICTDRASRGIDFNNVDHVVLFDFPRDPSEYVRRVGRTARGAGGEGKAFVFVVGKQVSLARRIMERNKKGHPVHDVPSAYELVSSVF